MTIYNEILVTRATEFLVRAGVAPLENGYCTHTEEHALWLCEQFEGLDRHSVEDAVRAAEMAGRISLALETRFARGMSATGLMWTKDDTEECREEDYALGNHLPLPLSKRWWQLW